MNYKVFDDAILLKLLKAGDGSALEEIYVRYSEMVFLAAYKSTIEGRCRRVGARTSLSAYG